MIARSKTSAEVEALEWAVDYFQKEPEILKPINSDILDFDLAKRWLAPEEFEKYLWVRIRGAGGFRKDKMSAEKARWDAISTINGLCEYAGFCMNEGKPLPKPLREFVIFLLLNPGIDRAKRGPRPRSLRMRNFMIIVAIQRLIQRWEFPATRNSASSKISAAAIVAEALGKAVSISLGEKAINRIWTESAELRKSNDTETDLKKWFLYRSTKI